MNNNIATMVHKITCRYRNNQVYHNRNQINRDELHTTRENLSDEHTLLDKLPSPQNKIIYTLSWLLLNKTWLTSILWQMDPLEIIAHVHWLLVDKTWQATIFQQMDLTPPPLRNNSIYALTTIRQKLVHKYTLADGPQLQRQQGCLEY